MVGEGALEDSVLKLVYRGVANFARIWEAWREYINGRPGNWDGLKCPLVLEGPHTETSEVDLLKV